MGTVQRALDINSLQLMLKQMPLSAAILLPVIVLAEDITSGPQPLVALQVTPQLIGVVVLTACMAFFVNVSTFYIIAELSPIRSPPPSLILLRPQTVCSFHICAALTRRRSYNVLGHCKTCVIIVGGALIFREVQPPPPLQSPPTSRALQGFDLQKAGGACCCVAGAFWYARLSQKPPPLSLDPLDESDGAMLHRR